MRPVIFLMRVRWLQQFLTASLLLALGTMNSLATTTKAQESGQWLSPLQQQHPLTGLILDTHSGAVISYQDLTTELLKARLVLIGEKHDNPDHHRLQLRLLQDLNKAHPYQLVLEMLNEKQNAGITEIQDKTESEALIRQKLDWDNRGWSWQDYGEIVIFGLQQADRLRSGNISRALLMDIYQDSAHPILDDERFKSMSTITDDQISTIRQQVFDSHCGSLPMEHTAPMARIQIARDASMAYAMHQSIVEHHSAILIAGAFHIRKDFGVPAHLLAMGHNSILTLQLQETDGDLSDWQDYTAPTEKPDYIWFTPKLTDKDYCAALRRKEGSEQAQQ